MRVHDAIYGDHNNHNILTPRVMIVFKSKAIESCDLPNIEPTWPQQSQGIKVVGGQARSQLLHPRSNGNICFEENRFTRAHVFHTIIDTDT